MDKLGIDPKLLIAQVINFSLFFFVFKKYLAKPFADYVANEKKKESEKAKMMQDLEEKHTRMEEEEKKWHLEIQKEKEAVIESAKKIAENTKTDILAQAKKDAEELIAKAETQISHERKDLYDDVKKRTIDLSTYIVEKGLKDYLTEDAKKNVTQHIITNMGKDVSQYEN